MLLEFETIELRPGEPEDSLNRLLSLKYGMEYAFTLRIVRKSLDARDKGSILYRYRVEAEVPDTDAARLLTLPGVKHSERKVVPPVMRVTMPLSVLIVGTGPAGLFCGLRLLRAGARVSLLERGRPVEERMKDIHALKTKGLLDPESNVLFGEGGAGTYSDGKLTTRTHRPEASWFFEMLVAHGAPESVLYEQRPHLGTDRLVKIIKSIRAEIFRLGGEIMFGRMVTDLIVDGGSVTGVLTRGGEEYRADCVVLATGHSARDTIRMLHEKKVRLSKKGFAVGVRAEHPADLINQIQYGKAARGGLLPAAEYQLAHNDKRSVRGVYTFCMCPGGEVVNSSSEEDMLCTNGMSYSARAGRFSNAAVVVSVSPEDIGGDALAALEFQREIERRAFLAGGGGYLAPAQRLTSFLDGKIDTSLPESSYGPGLTPARLGAIFPEWISGALMTGLRGFNSRMKGFVSERALLIGAETRTSSPVRIDRGEDFQSVSHVGLYPAGEGAGYAGGIVSSAVDGIRVADSICRFRAQGPAE
jgi:uncharacterized protein